MKKVTGFSTAVAEKYNAQVREKDHSTQIDPNTPTGGISISKGLLPAAQVGQVITLEVTASDDNTVHLKIV